MQGIGGDQSWFLTQYPSPSHENLVWMSWNLKEFGQILKGAPIFQGILLLLLEALNFLKELRQSQEQFPRTALARCTKHPHMDTMKQQNETIYLLDTRG